MTPKVDTHHPTYDELQPKRNDFAAVKGGTDAMRKGGEKYLPKYPGEADGDYKIRLSQSTIDGIVASGVDTLCGKVFDEEIDTSKVTIDKTWLENFDNEGTHFNNFARLAFEHSFDGCSLIISDLPPENEAAKALKKQRGGEADKILNIRPYSRIYTAANVINWHYQTNPITQIKELVLLVLREMSDEIVEQFERAEVVRYRVYTLIGGVVSWQLFKEVTENGEKKFAEDGQGEISNVKQIPASFIGKLTDEPKLLIESRLEIKAYQKESSFDIIEYFSVPTLTFIGRDNIETSQKTNIGASAVYDIPIGGDAKWLQIDASGNDSIKGTIAQIKDVIKQRISAMSETTNRVVDKTATESVIENEDKQARLVVWADELKDALERTLQFMGQLAGKGEDAAGEIVLGASWLKDESSLEIDLDDLDKRADIANKLDGLVSIEWLIKFLKVADEEEMKAILQQMRSDDVVTTKSKKEDAE